MRSSDAGTSLKWVGTLLLVQILLAGALPATFAAVLPLEHSFDGVTFKPAGLIRLGDTDGATATLEYSGNVDAQAPAFAKAAQDGGLYFVRLPSDAADPNGGSVVASIPARCWAQGGASTRLVLHMLEGGRVMAAALDAPCSAAASLAAPPASQKLPRAGAVELVYPVAAPKAPLVQPSQQQQQQQVGGQALPQQQPGAPGGKEGAKEPPPKDERTWLQKNWIFLALAAFMIANRLGATEDASAPVGGARPVGSGPPPRR